MATYSVTPCRHCLKLFQPASSRQKHCTPECRFREIASQFSGDGCWEWPLSTFSASGYGQFAISANAPELAHRMAYRVFVGDPGELFVCHRCDNRKCFNPAHLFLGSHDDNMADMAIKGRANRNVIGTARAYKSNRLNTDQLQEIYSSQEPSRLLGARFGIDHKTVLNIKKRFGTTNGSATKTELLAKAPAVRS